MKHSETLYTDDNNISDSDTERALATTSVAAAQTWLDAQPPIVTGSSNTPLFRLCLGLRRRGVDDGTAIEMILRHPGVGEDRRGEVNAKLRDVRAGATSRMPLAKTSSKVPASGARPAVAPIQVRHEAYTAFLGALTFDAPVADHLEADGWTRDEINTAANTLMYRWLPRDVSEAVRAALRAVGREALLTVPGFFLEDGLITAVELRGIAMPVRDPVGRIGALQVRHHGDLTLHHADGRPKLDPKSGQPKQGIRYVYFSSSTKPTAKAPTDAHVTCIGEGPDILVTEGPKKADLVALRTGRRCVAVLGVGNWRTAVPALEMLSASSVEVALDADALANKDVANATAALYRVSLQVRPTSILRWAAASKGIDDALIAGVKIDRLTGEDAELYAEELQPTKDKPFDTQHLEDQQVGTPPADCTKAPAASKRPTIRLSTETHEVVEHAVTALHAEPVYVRGTRLVSIVRDPDDGLVADKITPSVLGTVVLSRCARWEAFRKSDEGGRWVPTTVPRDIAQAVYDLGRWPSLPRLRGVITTPMMRPDGSVLITPGYDAATQYFYDPSGVEYAGVPERPTRTDAEAARDRLLAVVRDFPLISSGRSVYLASVLTYFARPMFEGPSPCIAIDANTRGTGKGLLADVLTSICLGRSPAITTLTEDEDELRKRITATLIKGTAISLFDNVPNGGDFGGSVLDALFTSTMWGDRKLGVTEMIDVPNTVLWLVTANNIALKGDTTRRVLHARMETDLEHPERRTDFAENNLTDWVNQNRAQLVLDALTILRAWVVANRPKTGVSLGSFQGWAAVVGEVVAWLGLGDVTDTQKEYEQRTAVGLGDAGILRPLLTSWHATFGDEQVTAAHVLRLLAEEDRRVAVEQRRGDKDGSDVTPHRHVQLRDAIIAFAASKSGGLPVAAVLGKKLGKAVKRVVGGQRFEVWCDRDKLAHYRVTSIDGTRSLGGTRPTNPDAAPLDTASPGQPGLHEHIADLNTQVRELRAIVNRALATSTLDGVRIGRAIRFRSAPEMGRLDGLACIYFDVEGQELPMLVNSSEVLRLWDLGVLKPQGTVPIPIGLTVVCGTVAGLAPAPFN